MKRVRLALVVWSLVGVLALTGCDDLAAEDVDVLASDVGEDPWIAPPDAIADPGNAVDVMLDTETGLTESLDAVLDGSLDGPPSEFHWAFGCEGSGTHIGPWKVVKDTAFHRGPAIQMSDFDAVTVVWRTAMSTQEIGCVEYQVDDVGKSECGYADEWSQYEIALDNLPPATEISYSVSVGDTKTDTLTFRTMPDRPIPMKFAVFADGHDNLANYETFSELALEECVDFAVGVGDFTGHGSIEQFDSFFEGVRTLVSRVNLWTVIGNHDEKNKLNYFRSFVLPEGNVDGIDKGLGEGWWSQRIGNVWMGGGWIRDFYMSMPDSDWGEVGWFREQFQTEAFKTAQWKLFFIHEPPYGTQSGDCDYQGENSLRVALVPLMEEYGIHASIHGHVHCMEWAEVSPGYHMIVTGTLGGGIEDGDCSVPDDFPQPWHGFYGQHNFAIVETGCDALTFKYVDLSGQEITRIEIPADGTSIDKLSP